MQAYITGLKSYNTEGVLRLNTNRHALKRRHKRELQKQYMRKYSYGREQNLKLFEDKQRNEANEDSMWIRKHPPRNGGWEYWKQSYLTGMRQYAKKFSDKRIRQKYRIMIDHYDPEDVTAPQGSDYEKEYDYMWTVW